MLIANLTRFVSPSYMAWTVSGELIVMTVLGGLGTLIGPIAGATALLLVEEALSSLKLGVPWLDNLINQHWLALIGIFIVLVVLVLKQGIYGWLVVREESQAERRAAPKPAPASPETGLALGPSTPAQAGMEPRPSFPSGDRPPYSADEGQT
jgi:hypothetical protein